MKKTLAVALALGLLAGALVGPADAGKKKKKKPVKVTREVQGSYSAPATVVGACSQTDAIGCVRIPSGPGEKYLTAEVTDGHGQPVVISVQADLDGDNRTETVYGAFCGKTEEPIQVDEGVEVTFWVGSPIHAVPNLCAPGIGTQGTIDVTFSNLP